MSADSRTTNPDGTLARTADGRYVIAFERRIAHPPARVWAALTQPEELIGWWGRAQVDLREGGQFTLTWLNTDDEGNSLTMHATIAKLEPESLLVLDGDVHGLLRWELAPDGDGTLLSFRSTVELQPDFLTKVPAGWHMHLDLLAAHLEGGETDLVNLPGWDQIHAAYEAKLAASRG
jgi:uncharacterized protein YndB with AHSA1/START domain